MINVWNYLDEYEVEKDEIHSAISSVLESGQLILGPHVKKFEEDFSERSISSLKEREKKSDYMNDKMNLGIGYIR